MLNKGTITIAGKSENPLTVNRLGYGTMRLTGEGIYGEHPNRPEALQILKRAVEAGVNFIDTADYYGEDVTNRLIYEALYPYGGDLVICTKVGATRKPDKSWIPFNTPENLRSSIENNLRTLKIEQVSLVHFRVMPGVGDFEESMEAMFQMQQEGKILHVGVSNVSRDQLETAIKMGPVATVENMYGHAQRNSMKSHYGDTNGGAEVLDICEANGIPLVPYFSLFMSMPKKDTRIAEIAKKYAISEVQANIAWLLHRSPWILPIPGTSALKHFEENLKAAEIELTKEDMDFLE
ncbi:aldo/keto reductase [Mucilaginibacter gotjawali]|uniref:Aryl-alcohol dehydrogenase-like predicted oxidoreductase n=2 Tax=Mucilaginibacter gotjawali TaxID=1550579 RepID=A0A839SM04_9SPHI|nr:aldo/keto reductase [Mucilaginibacter gotjawali]MBB3058363.1 aryl-alcohol dehydrogenase-like predicted oxidoreductase [Mucilaginibacter gotjawali]BAU55517.1 putative oxidoreductase YdbC [Mucilaginibacter gotjawali]